MSDIIEEDYSIGDEEMDSDVEERYLTTDEIIHKNRKVVRSLKNEDGKLSTMISTRMTVRVCELIAQEKINRVLDKIIDNPFLSEVIHHVLTISFVGQYPLTCCAFEKNRRVCCTWGKNSLLWAKWRRQD